jgi:hypothetical protein
MILKIKSKLIEAKNLVLDILNLYLYLLKTSVCGVHKTLKFLETYIIISVSALFIVHLFFLYAEDQNVIELLIASPTIKRKVDYQTPISRINLGRNTEWTHLVPCGVYLNELEEMKTALQCVNSKVYKDSKIPENTVIPRCFVVTAASPDVYSVGGVNFIPLITLFEKGSILGYFDTDTNTVFVVENLDIKKVYRHELQHYFLKLKGGTGGGHDQDIWKQCEEPYYDKSDKVKLLEKLERLEELEKKQ